jgi:3D (Asp-Asp-Asp) domain-containing protein
MNKLLARDCFSVSKRMRKWTKRLILLGIGAIIITSYLVNKTTHDEDLARLNKEISTLRTLNTKQLQYIDKLNGVLKDQNKIMEQMNKQLENIKERQKRSDEIISRGKEMRATAYDLSVASCGKRKGDPYYGITATGTRATEKRTVAVDPSIIPLGSQLFIVFPSGHKHLNGVYIAEDTGSAIRGNKIDIFLRNSDEAWDFGIKTVKVYMIR